MIIDDEVDFCLLLRAYLSKRDYEVFVAYTLKEGISQIDEVHPDIVFLDNNLPDGLGWEKADFIYYNYPLIELNLISAYKTSHTTPTSHREIKIWEKPINVLELGEYFK